MAEVPLHHTREYVRSILLGAILASMMNGILLVQMFLYFRRYKDSVWLKCLVGISGTISFAGFLFAVFYVFTQTLDQDAYCGLKMSTLGIAEFCLSILTPGAQAAIVQGFFGWRASRFIGSNVFFIGVIISIVIQMCAETVAIILNVRFPQVLKRIRTDPACAVFEAFAAVTDIAISAILIYHLMKRRTGHPDSDDLISKVTRLTLQTGLLSFSWGIATSIIYATDHPIKGFAFTIPLPALYANNLLAALNSRLYPRMPGNRGPSSNPAPGLIHLSKSPIAISAVTSMHFDSQGFAEPAPQTTSTESSHVEPANGFDFEVRRGRDLES